MRDVPLLRSETTPTEGSAVEDRQNGSVDLQEAHGNAMGLAGDSGNPAVSRRP